MMATRSLVVTASPQAIRRSHKMAAVGDAHFWRHGHALEWGCKPGRPSVQEIADWLEQLGLGQYAERFAENEIDVSVLPHLTDQDLKDIGIPLGHRRKLFAAINEPTTSAAQATKPSAASKAPEAPDAGE